MCHEGGVCVMREVYLYRRWYMCERGICVMKVVYVS